MKTHGHSAVAQMAGYLFQPERVLYWLAKSPRGSAVGVELEDDVVVRLKKGHSADIILEQLKKSSSTRIPFSDTSKDLWNTLNIWLELAENDVVNIDKTQFHMVTNKQLNEDTIVSLIAAKELDTCIKRLKVVGAKPSDAIRSHSEYILDPQRSSLLSQLLSKIEVYDNLESSNMKELVLDEMSIPETLSDNDIYNAMLGWIHEVIIEKIKLGEAPLVTKASYSERLAGLIISLSRISAVEKAARFIPISKADRAAHKESSFVRQLLLVAFEKESNEVLEAIDDYLRCESERVRLTTDGKITKDDFIDFDDKLVKIWQRIRDRKIRQFTRPLTNPELLGQEIYYDTVGADRREPLAGRPTVELYLTSGRYHYLANQLSVGWHPDYKKKLQAK